jgi:hypothetical protein
LTVRRILHFAVVLVVAGWFASLALGEEPTEVRVTYLAGDSVYVAAGERDGLARGTKLESVGATGNPVVLEVSAVSARRAVCNVTEGARDAVSVGDRFRYTAAMAPAMAGFTETEPERPGAWQRSGLRGRVGVRYLATRNRGDGQAEFSEPAVDLRLDGNTLYGSAFSLHADVRARRTTRTLSDGSDETDNDERVYRFALGWDRPGTGWRFTVGRQFSPDLANVSVFDGASGAYDHERWSTGMFTGSQPDGTDYGVSSDVREHGAFFQFRHRPGAARHWALTTGVVGSYEDSEINREYLFLQGRYTAGRLVGFLTQEVDVGRGWKEDAGEDSLTATSTFVSLHYRVTDTLRLRGGYDSRRNVRLYRDRVTPVTDFDDRFRRGAWLGGSIDMGKHFRVGLDGRANRSGSAGDSDAVTVRFGAHRLTSRNGSIRVRSTRYEDDRLEGQLYSLAVSIDVGARIHLAILGGVRDEESLLNAALDDSVTWYGADVDIDLGRRVYLVLSAERSDGDFEEVDQFYATLACRF